MQLYLLRHTQVDVGPDVCYGQTDVGVGPDFLRELRAVRGKLRDTSFHAVYSSPLLRCHKLAEALAPGRVVPDARLLELNFGRWELKKWGEIPRAEFDAWARDFQTLSPPGGESFAELQQRARLFIEELKVRHPQQNVLAVAHGGLIRTMLAQTLDLSLENLFRLEVDYGSITQLNYGGAIPSVGFVNR